MFAILLSNFLSCNREIMHIFDIILLLHKHMIYLTSKFFFFSLVIYRSNSYNNKSKYTILELLDVCWQQWLAQCPAHIPL